MGLEKCHINAELRARQNSLFLFPPFFFLFYLSGPFLYGNFSDEETNNLVNTQTDTDRRPALQPPPQYITLGANGEQGVSQRESMGDWGWWCLIKFLGLSNCLS